MANRQDVPTCDFDRWLSLMNWCKSIGCCYMCCIMASCAIVQREAWNRNWGTPPTDKCANRHLSEAYCLDLVRTNWVSSPKKET